MNAYVNSAKHYHTQQVLGASAAEQVVMLYDAALKNCQKTKDCIAAGDIEGRHNANRKVMEIISYLQDTLDVEKGGKPALRLQAVYGFMLRRLIEVDFKNDPRICDEIAGHVRSLRTIWQHIVANEKKPAEVKTLPEQGAGGIQSRSAVA